MANNNAEDTLKELEDKLNQLKEQTDANKDELDNNCVKWDDLGLFLNFYSLFSISLLTLGIFFTLG